MSEFLRPEATAALARWAEALVGLCLASVGLWLGLTEIGAAQWFGWALALVGGSLLFTGVRHALFRKSGEAPGVVEIVEGRITYMGPILGGSVALSDLRRIVFRRTKGGEAFWTLTGFEPQPLIIPAGAQGVEQLLDAFTALPRFNTGALIKAVQSRTPLTLTIWQHPDEPALT